MPFHFITVSCYAHCPKDCRSTESMVSFSTSFFDLTEGSVLKLEAYRQEQGNVLFELDHILERAIHNKAFSLYYQPIYSIKEGRYNSAEALLRLEDPIFGTILPSLIIPYAENCGKIIDIGNIVLEKSFGFFVSKLRGKLDYLELNVSPLQLIDPGFASSLIAMAKSFEVEPKQIILEITESAAMPDDPSIQGNISALVEAGYRIAIDDFGTGFSNLSRLAQLDIHILKFDISITRMIDKDGRNEFILGLIKLFHGKGMKILFEGVESQDIASLLDKIGADYIQGYLYSPPRPEEAFLSLLD
jgi:EAL domain-containing protein (putative c-di-GMP-specific phosphodiesterase class I)